MPKTATLPPPSLTIFRIGLELELFLCLQEHEDLLSTLTSSKFRRNCSGKYIKRNVYSARQRLYNFLAAEGIPAVVETEKDIARINENGIAEERKGWLITTDFSLRTRPGDCFGLRMRKGFRSAFFWRESEDDYNLDDIPLGIIRGIELVSPPIYWCRRDWSRLVEPLIGFFTKRETERTLFPLINDTCGLHVHVEIYPAPLCTAHVDNFYETEPHKISPLAQIRTEICKNLAWIFYCFEPVIDSLHFPHRRPQPSNRCPKFFSLYQSSRYTIIRDGLLNGLTPYERFARVQNYTDLLTLVQSAQRSSDGEFVPERYYKYNFRSREKHGTVEFRQFGMQIEHADVRAWTGLCVQIMRKARSVKFDDVEMRDLERNSRHIESLIRFLGILGYSDEHVALRSWIRNRYEKIQDRRLVPKYYGYGDKRPQ